MALATVSPVIGMLELESMSWHSGTNRQPVCRCGKSGGGFECVFLACMGLGYLLTGVDFIWALLKGRERKSLHSIRCHPRNSHQVVPAPSRPLPLP